MQMRVMFLLCVSFIASVDYGMASSIRGQREVLRKYSMAANADNRVRNSARLDDDEDFDEDSAVDGIEDEGPAYAYDNLVQDRRLAQNPEPEVTETEEKEPEVKEPEVTESEAEEPQSSESDCTCEKDEATIQAEKPNCAEEHQKPYLFKEKCGCDRWGCIWVDCSRFDFDEKKPPKCESCEDAPVKEDDCGCPVWKCRRRECNAPENKEIKQCPSECDEVKSKPNCGCIDYSCEPKEPPTNPPCSEEQPCSNPCQECHILPWLGEACSNKTNYKQPVCEAKRCPPQPSCGECQHRNEASDSCGCATVTCLPKQVENKCVDETGKSVCRPCEECVFEKDSGCEEGQGGEKVCRSKGCPPSAPEQCRIDECLIQSTTKDECGCDKGCITQPDEGNCDECNECQICKTETICKAGNRTVTKYICDRKKAAIQECGECEEPVIQQECGESVQRCKPKMCSPLQTPPPPCTDPCHEPVVIDGPCGCKVYECQRKPSDPEEKPSFCDKTCAKCHKCEWVRNEQCGTWESTCTRKCDERPEVLNRICFGSDEYDECECPKPLAKKPCLQLYKGKCPKGSFKRTATDVCGCDHSEICEPCKPFDPLSCKECEMPVEFDQDEDGCSRGKCVLKECPIPEITCGPCQEQNITTDKCSCSKVKCVRKSCPPKKTCEGGKKAVTITEDGCGCPVEECVPDTECKVKCVKTVCPVEEVCEQCPPGENESEEALPSRKRWWRL